MICGYKLGSCCPDLAPGCDRISPILGFTVTPPTGPNDGNGTFTGTLTGLFTRFEISWSDGVNAAVDGNIFRGDLDSGTYFLVLRDLINRECVWQFEINIPEFNDLFVELFYAGILANPVPDVPVTNFNGPLPPAEIRWNFNRPIPTGFDPANQPLTGNQCYQLVIQGGQPPYVIFWEDYLSPTYALPPVLDAGATLQSPVNLANPLIPSRPPILASLNGATIMCFNLVPNNGNGWVSVTVTDSTPAAQGGPLQQVFWLYLIQNVLP